MQQSIPSSTDGVLRPGRVLGCGCGTGAEKLLLQHYQLLRMVGYGQHHIFSLWCPSRGVVNIPHHCLFKEDGVRVRSNGKSNPKSQVFSVSGETL